MITWLLPRAINYFITVVFKQMSCLSSCFAAQVDDAKTLRRVEGHVRQAVCLCVFARPDFTLSVHELRISEFGKLDLSCGVIVVNHFSHQVIVFDWAHIKQQTPDWETTQNHRIT